MQDIDPDLERIRKEEAMRSIGWGSLNKEKNELMLIIQCYKVENHLSDIEFLNFHVKKQNHTTINGKTTHLISVKENHRNSWQQPIHMETKTLIAKVYGTLKSFEFVLKVNQISELKRLSSSGQAIVKLLATKGSIGVRIVWMESDRIPFHE